ncbi:MAG: hypothetical protein ABH821_01220 [archaeon]
MKIVFITLFLIVLFLSAGCVQKENNKPQVSGMLKGVSLSPKSFQENDFQDFFVKAELAGNTVSWAGDWKELESSNGSPIVVAELSKNYGFTPLIEATFFTQSTGQLLRPLNEENKQAYKNNAVAFAEKYKPEYLGFGIEVNVLFEKSPKDFEDFVLFYNEVFDTVKEKSPNTKVFTVFQLEKMKGLSFWQDGKQDNSKTEWFLIDKFKSDVTAFTTYPGLVYKNPKDIPENYYNEIKNYTSKHIAFTEIGWHSKASPAGWESSETEQAEFIETFFALTKELDKELIVWSFLFDQKTIEPFDSMGLIDDKGRNKEGWSAWIEEGK